jgi:hypothetical protein
VLDVVEQHHLLAWSCLRHGMHVIWMISHVICMSACIACCSYYNDHCSDRIGSLTGDATLTSQLCNIINQCGFPEGGATRQTRECHGSHYHTDMVTLKGHTTGSAWSHPMSCCGRVTLACNHFSSSIILPLLVLCSCLGALDG